METMLKPEKLEETTKDDERRTHIVNPPNNLHIWREGMDSQDIVNIARVKQIPVKTLCGASFIPNKNPELFRACEECIRIAGDLMREMSE